MFSVCSSATWRQLIPSSRVWSPTTPRLSPELIICRDPGDVTHVYISAGCIQHEIDGFSARRVYIRGLLSHNVYIVKPRSQSTFGSPSLPHQIHDLRSLRLQPPRQLDTPAATTTYHACVIARLSAAYALYASVVFLHRINIKRDGFALRQLLPGIWTGHHHTRSDGARLL